MKPVKQENSLAVTGRLNVLATQDFKHLLLTEVYKLYLKNGQNAPEEQDVAVIVNELYDYLTEYWPGVKAEWIQEAFKRGITGVYGDFANISFRVMTEWIRAYRSKMTAADFGIEKDVMPTKERADFVLSELRKRNPDIDNIGK